MRFVLVLLSLIIMSCASAPSISSESIDQCGFTTVNGQRISWGNRLPVYIFIDDNATTQEVFAIQRAADTWSRAAGRALFQLSGTAYGDGPHKDGANSIFFVTNWTDNKSTLGIASRYADAGQLEEADVRINKEYTNLADGDPVSPDQYDLESIVLHELGHVLGLGHILDEPDSVMSPALFRGTVMRIPSAKDVERINCEY